MKRILWVAAVLGFFAASTSAWAGGACCAAGGKKSDDSQSAPATNFSADNASPAHHAAEAPAVASGEES